MRGGRGDKWGHKAQLAGECRGSVQPAQRVDSGPGGAAAQAAGPCTRAGQGQASETRKELKAQLRAWGSQA